MKAAVSLFAIGILFLVAVVSASLQATLKCPDVSKYYAKKGIGYCNQNISKQGCKPIDAKKTCDKTNQVAHRVRYLMGKDSEKLGKKPCSGIPGKEKEVKNKIDEIINKLNKGGSDPDVGTHTNPGESCEKILSDQAKPDGTYWIWGTDGKAVQIECKRGKPLPTSCDEIFKDPIKADGKYWINENGKRVEKDCKRGYSITLFDGPDFTGESLSLSDDKYDFWADNFNDKMSSFIVHQGKWTLCSNIRNHHDKEKPKPGDKDCHTFGVGSYNREAEVKVFHGDNGVSSAFKIE